MKRNPGLYLAAIHLAAFAATVLYTTYSPEGQAPLIWLFWALVDFPLSLFYWVGGQGYAAWVEGLSDNSLLLGYIFYTPHLIHGVVGTIWWYFLPRFIKEALNKRKPGTDHD